MKTSYTKSGVSPLIFITFIFIMTGCWGRSEDFHQDINSDSITSRTARPKTDANNQLVYVGTKLVYEETFKGKDGRGIEFTETREGVWDQQGRWHGPVKTRYVKGETWIEMSGQCVNGRRHGKWTSKSNNNRYNRDLCYDQNVVVRCTKKFFVTEEKPSAFDILHDEYTYYLDMLNFRGIDDDLTEEFLNVIETRLADSDIEYDGFDELYDEAINELIDEGEDEEDGKYEFFIEFTEALALQESYDMMRGNELRLAVLDRYISTGKSTFQIMESKYPGYLEFNYQHGATRNNMEAFCNDLDSRIDMGEPLDPAGLFFTDSIDSRIFKAMFDIMNEDESKIGLFLAGKKNINQIRSDFIKYLHNLKRMRSEKATMELSPKEISFVFLYTLIQEFNKADKVRQAVRDAYFHDHQKTAIVTTYYDEEEISNNISIHGNIIEDGGAAVTQRGIVWSTTYNPTTSNHKVISGSGTGAFTATLTGLPKGQTCYARAYAINSVGTAYGNVVEFTEKSDPTSADEVLSDAFGLQVFPVPTNDILHVRVFSGTANPVIVSLVNIGGQKVRQQEIAAIGHTTVMFNLEGLLPGIYFVRTEHNGLMEARKVIIQTK